MIMIDEIDPKRGYGVKKAARIAGVHPNTIRRRMHSQRLRYYLTRTHKHVRIRGRDLIEFIRTDM